MKRLLTITAAAALLAAPAHASYEFAGGALYTMTCAHRNGLVSQSEAQRLYRKTLRDEGIPMSYANHPRTIEASKGVFLVMGGC